MVSWLLVIPYPLIVTPGPPKMGLMAHFCYALVIHPSDPNQRLLTPEMDSALSKTYCTILLVHSDMYFYNFSSGNYYAMVKIP